MNNTIQDLAAALNGHEVTNEEGNVMENETSFEESATQETNTEDESDMAEKSPESEMEAPKVSNEEPEKAEEAELAEDESGKRYVPENRFKEVYGKAKSLERELQALKEVQQKFPVQSAQPTASSRPIDPVDRSEHLEVELLKATLPQFNPDSDQYSPALDEMGALIYKANMQPDKKGNMVPTITRLEAARMAVKQAKTLQAKEVEIIAEARAVKTQQSDHGITNRVVSRQASQPNFDSMSDREIEAYLKANGQW